TQPALRLAAALQSLGTAYGDVFVLRARLSREIVVGREMDHRGDAVPVAAAEAIQTFFETLVRGEVDTHALGLRRQVRGPSFVEADQGILLAAPPDQR